MNAIHELGQWKDEVLEISLEKKIFSIIFKYNFAIS
jgi:hypothetical protein